MKKSIMAAIGMVVIVSCKKDNLKELRSQVLGEWEFESASSVFFTSSLPSGNGKIMVIRQDGSYERRNHDTIIFQGRYSLESKKDCSGNDKKAFFSTNDSTAATDARIINIEGDGLFLNTSNCMADGGTITYRKR